MSETTVLLHRADGSTTAVISAGPRALRSPGGSWRPIRTALQRVDGRLKNTDNLIASELPASLETGAAARFQSPVTGAGLAWRPLWPKEAYGGQAAVAVDVARYPLRGPLDGITDEFVILRGGVKHNVHVPSRAHLTALAESADTVRIRGALTLDPGVRLQPVGASPPAAGGFVTAGAIDVIGDTGRLFTLPPPDARELAGARRSVRGRYGWDPRSGVLSVEFPQAWFEAPDRAFPVVLDPPATTTAGYMTHLSSPTVAGPADFRSGQDQVRLGAESFSDGDTDHYAVGLRFDVSAIRPDAVISGVGINVFYPSSPGAGAMGVHYERLSIDPETGPFGALWSDLNHSASELYASLPDTQSNTCNCWIGGTPSPASLGTPFNAAGIADLQAALSTGRFLVAMHATSYTAGVAAYPHTPLMANEPQLRVDFSGAAPTVTGVSPSANTAAAARTVTVLGTNFQNGATATMRPLGGGANTSLTVTYDAADRLQVTIPAGQSPGLYELQVTTSGGASAYTAAGRYTVLRATASWTGATSTDWNTASNWSGGVVPDAATPVNVPATARECITPGAGAVAHSVTVSGGTLRLGGLLSVSDELSHASGNLVMSAGTVLELGGNAFFHPTNFSATGGTVRFPGTGRSGVGALGKVLFDDFDGRSNLTWTVGSLGGSPNAWTLQDKTFQSPLRAYHQLGKQLNQGGSALISPSFNLSGRTHATLRWRTRYRVSPEGGTGPLTSDGWAVQVSTNNGATWTTVAPHATSKGPHLPKVTATGIQTCKANPLMPREENPVPPGPGGLFAGEQDEWIEDSVSLDSYLQPNVRVRFVSGWDNCNDYLPWEGVYIDDVSVEANGGALTLPALEVKGGAHLTLLTPLTVTLATTISSADATLELNSRDFSSASLQNLGALLRGTGGTFAVAGGVTNHGTLQLGEGDAAAGSLENSGTFTARSGALTVAGTLSTSGTMVLPEGDVTVGGDLTIGAGASLRLAGGQLDVAGHLSNAGVFASGPARVRLTGASATWSGGGSYLQARVREVLFTEGFEAGTLAGGGWQLPSHPPDKDPADVEIVPAPPGIGAGAKVVNLHQGNTWVSNFIARPQSTAGKTGIWLTFGWATQNDPSDGYELSLDYSLDGGGTWRTARQFPGVQATYRREAVNLSAIDPAVENNPGFAFRFRGVRAAPDAAVYLDEIAVEAGTPGMGPVVVAADPGAVKLFDPAATLPLTGGLEVASGTARIAPGKTVSLDPFAAVTATVSSGAVLDVEPSATLALSSNVTLRVDGALELVGGATPETKAQLTSTAPGATPSRYALELAGTLDASNFAIRHPNAGGLQVLPGATVLRLDDGAFHAPPAGGALLTLASATLPPLARRVRFENDLGVAGAINVDGSGTSAVIDFRDAVGTLEGEGFDLDDLSGANVRWSYTATQVAVSSATEPAPGDANAVTLTVALQDAAGHAAEVHPGFAATVNVTGSATVSGSPINIPNGAASANVTLLSTAVETVTVSLTETSATGLPVGTGTATFIAGSPAVLAFEQQPTDAVAGAPISPAVSIRLFDSWGNPSPDSPQSLSLTLEDNPAGGALSGTANRSSSGGWASFDDLSVQKTGDGYTLRASAPGLTAATSAPFAITPGAAAALAFAQQPPAAVTAGAPFSASAEVLDAFGNRTASSASVSLSIGGNPGGSTLAGGAPQAAAGGVAAFSGLGLNRAGAGYTLLARAPGLTDGVSAPFDVKAAAADRLAFRTPAPTLTAGTCSGALLLELQDALGNLATAAGEVALSLGGVTGLYGDGACGTAGRSATLPAGGSTLALSVREERSGDHTLRVTSAGLLAAALPVTVIAAAPSGILFASEGHTVRAGLCSPEVVVQTVDPFGNPAQTAAAGAWRLDSDAPTLSFFADAACALPLSELPAASAAAFHFLDTAAGAPSLTVEAGPLGSATQQQVVLPDPDGPPVIDRAVHRFAAVGLPYPYNAEGAVRVVGRRPMTFGSCGGPASLHVDSASGAVSWIPATPGPASLCVTARNDLGEDRFTFEVEVSSTLLFSTPVAAFTATPSEGPAPLSVAYDASGSPLELTTGLVSQRWDYGDGSPWEFGVTSAWSYLVPGGYTAELRVVDGMGREDAARASIRVDSPAGQRPPQARIATDGWPVGEERLSLTLRAETTPGDAPIRAWRWDLGDTVVQGDTLTHTFGPGRYRIRLVATDDNGLDGSDWIEVVVTRDGQQPPRCRAVLDPPAGPAPLTVRHEAFSADLDGEVTTRTTTLADGSAQSAASFTQSYAAPGRHRIAIRVVDDSALTCVDSAEVHALPATGALPPKIVSRGASAAVCGVAYRYASDGRPTVSGTGPFTWSVHPAPGFEALPRGLTIDEATGELRWTPLSNQTGSHGVVVRVSSDAGFDEETLALELTCEGALAAQVGCGCGTAAGGVFLPALMLLALRLTGRRRYR